MRGSREVRLSDITWGGRIRREYQCEVSRIARCAARSISSVVRGTMACSSQTETIGFLDGCLQETRGRFGPGSGMYLYGELARVYVLYELGLSPHALLRRKKLPPWEELQERVRVEAEAAHSGGAVDG